MDPVIIYCTTVISPFCGTYNRKPKLKKAKAPITAVLWTGEVFPHQPDGRALLCRAVSQPRDVRARSAPGVKSTKRQ